MAFVENRRRKRTTEKRRKEKGKQGQQERQYARLTDMSRQRLMGYAESFRELSEKFREEYGREQILVEPEAEEWSSRDRLSVLENRRNQENRQVIGRNLEEVAAIMEQVASTELYYEPLEEKKEKVLVHALRSEGIYAQNLCYLPGGGGSRTLGMVLRTEKKGGIAADEVAALISVLLKCNLEAAVTSPYVIDEEKRNFLFVEAVRLQAMLGISKVVKENETVSGDNFAILHSEIGKKTILLSDGTGSGGQAYAESSRVLDLMEKMLEAGFELEAAVGMVNRAMFAKGEEPGHPTLDICDIDLYSGACIIYKVGGAAAFLKQGRFVEVIRQGTLPLGIFEHMEPQPIRCRVAEGDYLVLLTDGVLEAFQGENDGEELVARHLQQMVSRNPQDMAEILLQLALKECGGHVRDDMTIIVVGVWEN